MSQRTNYVIVPIEDWIIGNHVVSRCVIDRDRYQSVPITYQGKPFFLKICNLYCRYGAEQYESDSSDFDTRSHWFLKLEFEDLCAQKIKQFDQFMIDQGVSHASQWFNKPGTSRQWFKEHYLPMCRRKMTNGWIRFDLKPYIKAKFVVDRNQHGMFRTDVFDEKCQLINSITQETITKILPRNCYCSVILYGSIALLPEQTEYTMSWSLYQVKIDLSPLGHWPKKGVCLFIDESNTIPIITGVINEDEDEDEEEENKKDEKPTLTIVRPKPKVILPTKSEVIPSQSEVTISKLDDTLPPQSHPIENTRDQIKTMRTASRRAKKARAKEKKKKKEKEKENEQTKEEDVDEDENINEWKIVMKKKFY